MLASWSAYVKQPTSRWLAANLADRISESKLSTKSLAPPMIAPRAVVRRAFDICDGEPAAGRPRRQPANRDAMTETPEAS
jgi:hypothetical protein